ncbi:SDR family oxidoreductase [Sporosarcina sp. Marseille-Q4063]|uniref:SDR family NAD(P)-dependent oxidoreductase n=1 Tax=Sporosarcina sp. Marseille-Q4063 TaxID=2810514 RepID=UPI001BAF983B|nr:SDR family oxidoreductase [Sporosarcina sp. Marseille-Q4063]QUW21227.1 SDR family oxidoreductase [Sporosarcina sp. Marseille-Q4063]
MTTAIVTGASRGIGRAAAIEMSNNPEVNNIVLIARDEVKLSETIKLLNPRVRVRAIVYDFSSQAGIPRMVKEIYDEFGSIDWLLNIAGYTDPKSLLDTTLASMERTYRINVFSLVEMTKECVKYMKQNEQSKILNVASTAGMTPRPGWLSYASSKSAVISISETLAQELSEYNILVYCISPGRAATDLRKKLAPEEDPTTIMQPAHVAKVIGNLMRMTEHCLDGQNMVVRKQVK